MKRELAAILYADAAGYTRATGTDEEATHRQLSTALNLLTDTIGEHEGTKIHEAGDAILAEFRSVTAALECGVDFQKRMASAADGAAVSLQFRVGINLGEIIHDRGDIYGDGVNLAARIESMAEHGGVCLSAQVYEQVKNRVDYRFDDLGHHKLKNVAEPVHLYQVNFADVTEQPHPAAFLTARVKSQPLFDLDGGDVKRETLITGRCLCGAVRYEITEPTMGTGVCHCRMCQRAIGAPMNAWAAFALDAVKFIDEQPQTYSSSEISERGFCRRCGTSLTYRLMKPEPSQFLVICSPTLDQPEDFAPAWHGGVESRLPWMDVRDDLPRVKCEESPSLIKAWSAVGRPDPEAWKPD